MKEISILIYLLVIVFPLDVYSQSGPQRVLGTFIYKNDVYNYEFIHEGANSYSFKVSTFQKPAETTGSTPSEQDDEAPAETPEVTSPEQDEEEPTNIPPEQADEEPTNIFAEFSQETFTGIFQKIMQQKYPDDVTSNDYKNTPIQVFFKIKARLDFIDDEPVTAYMILKDDSIKSYLKGNTSVYYIGALSGLRADHLVKRVNIETEDGAIKNISAHLVRPDGEILKEGSPRKYLEFKNHYPISISGKFDPDWFANTKLYCFSCYGIKGLTRYILLSELLILDVVLANDKEDYSPSNRTFSLSPLESIIELKKEKRSRILEVAAFTDFVGLDQEQPNGLIQVEVRRSININTRYYHFFSSDDLPSRINFSNVDPTRSKAIVKKKYTDYKIFYKDREKDSLSLVRNWHEPEPPKKDSVEIKKRRFNSIHYNFLGSMEPRLLFSKLEENNKYLILDGTTTLNLNEPSSLEAGKAFLDPIQVFRYQLSSFGTDLNLFKIAFPQLKFNWRVLNIGYFWYRTRLQESNSATEDATIPLNIQYWQLGTKVYFRPDSRWGVNIGSNYINQSIWNSSFDFLDKKGLMQTSFDAHLKTSDLSTLFFRFKWTHQRKNRDNNFTQIQLGYSLDLFSSGYTTQAP